MDTHVRDVCRFPPHSTRRILEGEGEEAAMSIEVRDVMGRVAIAVSLEATFTDIVAAMKRYAVGAVTVIDSDRRPVGVVSGDDLLLKETDTARRSATVLTGKRARQERRKAAGRTAVELMTSPAITVTPGTTVRDAARLMREQRIKQLPVIDPVTGRVIGTLHQADVLRVFSRPAVDLERDIRNAIEEPEGFRIDINQGIVRVGGTVEWTSQAVRLVEQVLAVEGVVDVISELTPEKDDLVFVPPLF
ncbi:CBS domain-containing protein [Nonomuraea sp. NPDC046570]|uniref:CBS domain-containing protein n=1 Tax=Nonomuraea sp. NPDC046570 TaxID=3155255 RepID=UPI0033D9AB2B